MFYALFYSGLSILRVSIFCNSFRYARIPCNEFSLPGAFIGCTKYDTPLNNLTFRISDGYLEPKTGRIVSNLLDLGKCGTRREITLLPKQNVL